MPPTGELAAASRTLIGQTVDHWRIEGPLGEGASGVVYKATHTVNGQSAALKVLKEEHSGESDAARRLLDEARAVAVIRHEGIVDIYGVGTVPSGQPYVAMELCEGETLDELLKKGPLPLAEAVELIATLSVTLEAVHAAGIIHRDLKPSNLFVVMRKGRRRLKLFDFGLARHNRRGRQLTAPGMIIGTPDHMAPEQIKGEAITDRTDVYAVGSVFFRMITGQLPYLSSSGIETLQRKLTQPPRRVHEVAPSLPQQLDALFLKLFDAKPSARPTLAELRAALQPFGTQKRTEFIEAVQTPPLPNAAGEITQRGNPEGETVTTDPANALPLDVGSSKLLWILAGVVATAAAVVIYLVFQH